jgi:hypothetical protein
LFRESDFKWMRLQTDAGRSSMRLSAKLAKIISCENSEK